MSKLTSKERNALPAKTFAGPNRSYPITDKSHAIDAKALDTQMEEKGKLSASAAAKIKAAANKKLRKRLQNKFSKPSSLKGLLAT